jgi:hypothetical protein
MRSALAARDMGAVITIFLELPRFDGQGRWLGQAA